jgi:CubicO group peptidase (beta-lactamase class C family)
MSESGEPVRNWAAVDRLVRRAAREGVFPGAVLAAGDSDGIWHRKAFGIADCRDGAPVSPDTIFDLASLTKPLATALTFLQLWQAGRVHPGDRLDRWLPPPVPPDKAAIRLEQLLAHTSGFPAHRPFYRVLRRMPLPKRKTALRRWLLRLPLQSRPGVETRYSDLGFMVLAWVLEAVSGDPLDRWSAERIYGPLGLGLHFPGIHPTSPAPPIPSTLYAATERCGWRKRILRGEVHDDNAWTVGGVDGHAGLFGTAADVYRLVAGLCRACRMGGPDNFWPSGLLRRLLTPVRPGLRAMGFDVPTGDPPACGRGVSRETAGHLGFTGTSFWMDLEADRIVVLLTNRVHPSRWNTRIRDFRPPLHDAVRAVLG